MSERSWYLLKTKTHKERTAIEQLALLGGSAFTLWMRRPAVRFGRAMRIVTPLFPGYVFASFDLTHDYFKVVHSPGVHSVVRIGGELAVVPGFMLDEIKGRANGGPIEVPVRRRLSGDRVTINDGPLKGLEAVFQRYMSGERRVAILLNFIGTCATRVVVPAHAIS
jgi:transcriptional antiterminator RfaH